MARRAQLLCSILMMAAAVILGCGGGNSNNGGSGTPPGQPADFTLSSPASVTVTPNSSQTIAISIAAQNGFASQVSVSLSGLPSGVIANPSTFTLMPGASAQKVGARSSAPGPSQNVVLTASASVTPGPIPLMVTATSGSLSHIATASTSTADFAFAGPSAPVALTAGSTAQIKISTDAFNGFSGQVTTTLSGLPTGVTASPSTLTSTPGTAQTVTLTAASSLNSGSSTFTLQGTSGSLSHNLEFSLVLSAAPPPPPPADFTLSVAPGALSLAAGGASQSVIVSATAVNGFSGTINVTLSSLPSGVAAMPASFTLTPGTPQQVTFAATSSVASSTATVAFNGSSGNLTHIATVGLTVTPPAPNFSLQVTPGTLTLTSGGSAQTVSVTANPVGAFSSPVSLMLTGLSAGVTASPSSLTLTPGTAQTISMQASSSATDGQTTVAFQGSSGALTQSSSLSLTVAAPSPDFQLFAGPATLNLGTTAQALTVALIPLNGFDRVATVTVTGLPPGVTLLNQPLPLVANLPQALMLNAAGATANQSTITVTATAGSITHTAQANLAVSTPTSDFNPDLFAGSNPGAAKLISGLLLAPGTYTFSVIGGFPGLTVELSGLVASTGLDQSQYTFSSYTDRAVFTITTTSQAVGERGVLRVLFSGPQITHEVDLPIYVVPQPTIVSYIAPLTMRQGEAVDLIYEAASTSVNYEQIYLAPGWPPDFLLNPYLADSNPSLPVSMAYPLESAGSRSISALAGASTATTSLPIQFAVDNLSQVVPVPTQVLPFADFEITAEPQTIALNGGATQTVTIAASAAVGLSKPVNVSLDNLPAGVQASPQTFSVSSGSSQLVTLTAAANPGSGVVKVDASAGGLTRSTQIGVSPGSFTGDLTVGGNGAPGFNIFVIYTSGEYLDVSPLGQLDGLNATAPYALPGQADPNTSNCGGSATTPGCTPVGVALSGPVTTGIGSNTPTLPMRGTIVLDAIFGGGTQYAIVPFVQSPEDFSLTFSPASLTIPAGSSATLSITAQSPFCAEFNSSPPSPSSPNTFVAQITAPLPLGPASSSGSGVNLCNPQPATISVPANVLPGNYELTVAAQVSGQYQLDYNPAQPDNPYISIFGGHIYGVPVTVTAAPPGGFQLVATPSDISLAAGQSFPVTISAAGTNGFTGAISVAAANLPAGVTISPATFSLNAGSSQQITVSVASGTAAASDQVTLTGTAGSVTNSTAINLSVTGP